jgi:hypothetical protein
MGRQVCLVQCSSALWPAPGSAVTGDLRITWSSIADPTDDDHGCESKKPFFVILMNQPNIARLR